MFDKETWKLFHEELSSSEDVFTDANGVPWMKLEGYMEDFAAAGFAPLSLEDLSESFDPDYPEEKLLVRWDVNDEPNDRYTILPSFAQAEKVLLMTGILQAKESKDA